MFFAALVHELGHIAASRFFKGRLEAVEFGYSGITMKAVYPRLTSYFCDGVCALAGPVANLVWGIAVAMFSRADIAFIFAGTNIIFGLYNLIPVFGLDGGVILEALFLRILPIGAAQKCMLFTAAFFSFLLLLLGVFVFWRSRNITLFVFGVGLAVKVLKYGRSNAVLG